MAEVRVASKLHTSTDRVWAHARTLRGVNAELQPWVAMTAPRGALTLDDVPTDRVLFSSILLFLGIVPFDVHHLRMAEVRRGWWFRERSSSWLHRSWGHDRTLSEHVGGCVLEDRVVVRCRIPLVDPLVGWLVGALFRHRHRYLRRRFGGREARAGEG